MTSADARVGTDTIMQSDSRESRLLQRSVTRRSDRHHSAITTSSKQNTSPTYRRPGPNNRGQLREWEFGIPISPAGFSREPRELEGHGVIRELEWRWESLNGNWIKRELTNVPKFPHNTSFSYRVMIRI